MLDNQLAGLDSGELLQALVRMPAKNLQEGIERSGRVVVVLVQSSRGVLDNIGVSWTMLVATLRSVQVGFLRCSRLWSS